ncbi:MAG: hypothetical protein ABSC19_07655 [Syntrophorhabdales bacterium]|jgi:ABC-type lipoprotein release transport system permease subunit
MRLFFLQDFRHWLLGLFLGLVLAILVYLAFRSYRYSSERANGRAGEESTYPDDLKAKNMPTPPFIIFLYVGFVVWAICYVIFIGLLGGPI